MIGQSLSQRHASTARRLADRQRLLDVLGKVRAALVLVERPEGPQSASELEALRKLALDEIRRAVEAYEGLT